jgi:hypothetical protein
MGRLVAAQQLDDDVCVQIGDEVGRSVRQEVGRQASIARRIDVTDGNPDQFEPLPAVRRESIGSFREDPDDLAADRAGTEQRNPKWGGGHRDVTGRRVHMAPRS